MWLCWLKTKVHGSVFQWPRDAESKGKSRAGICSFVSSTGSGTQGTSGMFTGNTKLCGVVTML